VGSNCSNISIYFCSFISNINVWVLYADIEKATKIKIAETVIFPTVTYGSES
jgi:hypothetical protein